MGYIDDLFFINIWDIFDVLYISCNKALVLITVRFSFCLNSGFVQHKVVRNHPYAANNVSNSPTPQSTNSANTVPTPIPHSTNPYPTNPSSTSSAYTN